MKHKLNCYLDGDRCQLNKNIQNEKLCQAINAVYFLNFFMFSR